MLHSERGVIRGALLLSAALLSGCGDSTGVAGNSARAADDPPAEEGPFEPTIEAIQENVFTPTCTECHAGNVPSGNLSLDDAQTSYDNLVDVDSREVSSLKRVSPGDPDNSYLIHKLEGTQESGAQMPKGREPLDQETIDVIRQWITDGAPPPQSEADG